MVSLSTNFNRNFIAIVLFSLVSLTISEGTIERNVDYFGYTNRESDIGLKLRRFNDDLQIVEGTFNLDFYIQEEISLAPFHIISMNEYTISELNSSITNYNGIKTIDNDTKVCIQNYCNYIPHTFAAQNSLYKKHYVMWIINQCFEHILYPRVRNFDDIGEARQYFKKVLDQMKKNSDIKYAIILVSKEGLNILEKYEGYSSSNVINFLKGEKISEICVDF